MKRSFLLILLCLTFSFLRAEMKPNFIDYMLSDVMKDFEDSDPANGVVYSREWVAAKNYMRCATLAGDDGDAKGKADFTEKAKPLYKAALEKAKDDKVSLDELQKEMKAYGL